MRTLIGCDYALNHVKRLDQSSEAIITRFVENKRWTERYRLRKEPGSMVKHRTPSVRYTPAVIAVGVLLVLAQVGMAQEPEPLERGERVRVVTVDQDGRVGEVLLVGTLARLERNTVFVASVSDPGEVQAFALGPDRSLQASRGRRGHARRGLLVGALTGVIIGAVVPCDDADDHFLAPSCSELRPAAVLIFGVGGAGIGALIGASIRTERWAGVPWGAEIGLLSPGTAGHFAVGLRLNF